MSLVSLNWIDFLLDIVTQMSLCDGGRVSFPIRRKALPSSDPDVCWRKGDFPPGIGGGYRR
jgi:hypothetical protein